MAKRIPSRPPSITRCVNDVQDCLQLVHAELQQTEERLVDVLCDVEDDVDSRSNLTAAAHSLAAASKQVEAARASFGRLSAEYASSQIRAAS